MEDLYLNRIPVISILASKSGTGKTTLIKEIIKNLKSKSYKVGVIKHDVHKFQIDYPGKDTYQFTEAGADNVVIASGSKLALIQRLEVPKTVEELLWLFPNVDIIICEGFKGNIFPKIEVHRKEINESLLYKNSDISNFIAVASNEKLELDIPVLDLNDAKTVTKFIEDNFLRRTQ
ncbi:molybdopterin-guanine dinucleotide biosynthesis protein B [Clostridium sp. CX1]|uniref:molybdopterin-guanine dinucleotide biosynthesis protein B n=1 Tax=Clostridium sp. CX1 TaxID=2978346 RepID=UPI0021BF4191|nr:molybdopterin-guanine dinucleotide biosynthesis protein B [Clostridium sp. CX1]MCT8978226.1 molybdopterin-guanine dinucleotide biosynthesis protein B [Clostridium sp. CX1]